MTDTRKLMAKINKAFGEETLKLAKDVELTEVVRIPSGSLFLDWALGTDSNGQSGWVLGRIAELYGPPSSGKSLISLKTIAEAQKDGLVCAYLDAEKTFDKAFAKKLGVDVDKLLLYQVVEGEKAMDIACEILKDKSVSILVVDSVASLVPKTEMVESLEKATMAETARLMSKALRKLTALNERCLLIFINQLRVNPGAGPYANPEYTPGGKSLGFYSSIRIEVRRGDWIVNENKDKVGQVIKFKATKNKTAVPYKSGYFRFLYSGDIDKTDELISLGLLRGAIDKRGAFFYINDDGFQGRERLEKALRGDKKLFEVLKKKVFEI